VKPNINSVEEVHLQLSNNGHPLDGALVGAGSLWPRLRCLLKEAPLAVNPPLYTCVVWIGVIVSCTLLCWAISEQYFTKRVKVLDCVSWPNLEHFLLQVAKQQ